MNIVDAQRVMAIMDEAIEQLRAVSYLTPAVLDSSDEAKASLGKSMATLLKDYHAAYKDVEEAALEGFPAPDHAFKLSRELVRLLRDNPTVVAKLQALQPQPARSFLMFIDRMTKLREIVSKRQATSVEEQASKEDYLEEIMRREERANKECLSLEHQLKLEKKERSKAMQQMQEAERRARADMESVNSMAARLAQQLAGDAAQQEEMDVQAFEEREKFLTAEVEKLRTELATVQKEARELETQMRQKKKKSEQEVINWLGEYDKDMMQKEETFQEIKEAYTEVKAKLRTLQEYYAKKQAEDEKRRIEQEKLDKIRREQETREAILNNAARYIQACWRRYQQRKKEAEKAAKKKKGKKSPKKGGSPRKGSPKRTTKK